MATEVVMPALGMAQEVGKLVSWLKRAGDTVTQGEPIMEVETDKATVEIEAPASGILSDVSAREGDEVPVGQTIAVVLAPGEAPPQSQRKASANEIEASPVARRMAEEHGIDLAAVKPDGGRVNKEDILAYLSQVEQTRTNSLLSSAAGEHHQAGIHFAKTPASPKARRLAQEAGLNVAKLQGSGPGGAVLAEDVLSRAAGVPTPEGPGEIDRENIEIPGTTWRLMAERMSDSWTRAPHFYLMREARASSLVEMRSRITPSIEKRTGVKPTYTDLLIKLVAATLRDHPRLNASWTGEGIRYHADINLGVAVGIEDGLVVPVIHHADTLTIGEIARQRQDLILHADQHRLRPPEISGGTFTITNLGMYGVDAFIAVLNPPQAAILAVGKIAERVVPEEGQPAVRPTIILTLSCDHRLVDGMRAAQFLDDLTNLIEEPWGLLA